MTLDANKLIAKKLATYFSITPDNVTLHGEYAELEVDGNMLELGDDGSA